MSATPGPWTHRAHASKCCAYVHDARGVRVAAVSGQGRTEAIDTAALIAKAPELRDMLADLVEWGARMGGWDDASWTRAAKLLKELR